ncbi:PTS sugar transporter subunit IIA [Herbiconiux moechotypicola]|uniref:Ascorbate-specific PTS system EIIA component n=1 Tax=Herbiconiux moechotypicola TaxID=637393 RepID=A0ABN3DW30_9MICO|nr:PTS sugar transporter subunit IIA [Herbiconiux moechotypicola]MCS5730962.1 PTS sugar transporter subunit IIA [Herbiconiux moechotypicola]
MVDPLRPLHELPDAAIALHAVADDWRDAIRASAQALAAAGFAEPEYGERMIALVEEFGPYIVIAPGLALAHARPGPDVHGAGLSIVTLAQPVAFGHSHNDPVSVVLGLAATENDQHVASIASLANVFNDESVIPAIAAAVTADEVRALLRRASSQPAAGA